MELLRRPAKKANEAPAKSAKVSAADMFPGDVRLNVGIPEAVRIAAKKRAMDHRITLRLYILRLLANDGIEEAAAGWNEAVKQGR
jgi:hypothetical protein